MEKNNSYFIGEVQSAFNKQRDQDGGKALGQANENNSPKERLHLSAHSVKLCIYANVPLSFCTSAQCKTHDDSIGAGKKIRPRELLYTQLCHRRGREEGNGSTMVVRMD